MIELKRQKHRIAGWVNVKEIQLLGAIVLLSGIFTAWYWAAVARYQIYLLAFVGVMIALIGLVILIVGSVTHAERQGSRARAKFSILFFSFWGLCSWAIFEGMFPRSDYSFERPFVSSLALIISLVFLLATGLPSFLYLRNRDIRLTGRILVPVVIIASFLIFFASSSSVNKMRLQWYIKDLENLGFTVTYNEHFLIGSVKGSPPRVDTYSNFTNIAENLGVNDLRISAGVPYYFVFFFPRTIEMVCSGRGFTYVFRVD